MSDRRACCIPFCNRTSKPAPGQWICGKHWILADKALRSLYSRARRRFESGRYPNPEKQLRRGARLWQRILDQVLTRAVAA